MVSFIGRTIKLVLWSAFVVVVLIVMSGSAIAQTPSEAASTFEKRCYSCHNIGGGDKKGPDLNGATSRRSKEWLHKYIEAPSAMNSSGDPVTKELFRKFAPEVMPDQALTPDQIDGLLSFIAELSSKNQQFVPAGAKLSRPIVPADVVAGERYFEGQNKLSGGGTACISCHNVRGISTLGGGTLGPDLTAVNVKYRDPELISILQNPNFPTMKTVFAAHPINNEEIVALFAFLQNAKLANPQTQPQIGQTSVEPKFVLIGSAALLLALFSSNLIWRNRLRGVREQIVRRR